MTDAATVAKQFADWCKSQGVCPSDDVFEYAVQLMLENQASRLVVPDVKTGK